MVLLFLIWLLQNDLILFVEASLYEVDAIHAC